MMNNKQLESEIPKHSEFLGKSYLDRYNQMYKIRRKKLQSEPNQTGLLIFLTDFDKQ